MGLFEFMAPPAGEDGRTGLRLPGSYDVRLTATVDGAEVATGTATRHTAPDTDVTRTELRPARGDPVYGDLYVPRTPTGRRAAVVVFGGSEGGPGRSSDAPMSWSSAPTPRPPPAPWPRTSPTPWRFTVT